MSKNSLKGVKRKDLLEIIREQSEQNRQLTDELERMRHDMLVNSKKRSSKSTVVPGIDMVEREILRTRNPLRRFFAWIFRLIFSLIIVAVVIGVVLFVVVPVVPVFDNSMEPYIDSGDIVVSLRGFDFKQGDIISVFSLKDRQMFVRRCIASEGQTVNVDSMGNIYVDGEIYRSEYVTGSMLKKCEVSFPYVIPNNTVMYIAEKSAKVDEGYPKMGFCSESAVLGKVFYRIFPFEKFGAAG